MRATYEVRLAGDAALLVVPAPVDGVWKDAARVADALRRMLGPCVLDVVPAADSVLVRFDPRRQEAALLMAAVRGAADLAAERSAPERHVAIGVCFGGEFGPDLYALAASTGVTPDAVTEQLTAAELRVGFLGFVAGFPYMYGVPERLHVPRLPTPRTSVPAGSVALAAGMCGIYPRSTPGGWMIVGRTAAELFDARRDPPALLRPGDAVRLHAVSSLAEADVEVSA